VLAPVAAGEIRVKKFSWMRGHGRRCATGISFSSWRFCLSFAHGFISVNPMPDRELQFKSVRLRKLTLEAVQ
jgi:hypothetical protein